MSRIQSIIDELDAMLEEGMLPQQKHAKAVHHVRSHPGDYSEDTGMSISECADLAVDMAPTVRLPAGRERGGV